MAKTRYILSIDGGGIRGIIPAMILAEIEKRTKRRITDIFYMLGGSESGGLVVATVNHNGHPQYSANDAVDIFKKHGPKIFGSREKGHTGAKYSDQYLNSLLNDYFENQTIAAAKRRAVFTSYDIYNNKTFFMDSMKEDARLIEVKDIVRATMAVPTLFLPKEIRATKEDGTEFDPRVLVCGPLTANNPAGYAYATTHYLWPKDKLVLLSLGTGRTNMYITPHDAKNLTGKDWIRPLRQITFSSNQGINYLLSSMLESNFIRIQGSTSSPASAIDDASEENIKALEQEAINTIKEHEVVIDKFCKSVADYVGDDSSSSWL